MEKLQEFFQMIYELDLQVEQEGDHIDDLMTSLAFSECLFFFASWIFIHLVELCRRCYHVHFRRNFFK